MKKERKIEHLKIKVQKSIKILKIKFALFFFISLLLLLSFDYYICCFCGVYSNTQTHLIKDTIISFSLTLFYPFGTLLIPGIFRIPALHDKNKDSEYMYKFSKFIQSLFI